MDKPIVIDERGDFVPLSKDKDLIEPGQAGGGSGIAPFKKTEI